MQKRLEMMKAWLATAKTKKQKAVYAQEIKKLERWIKANQPIETGVQMVQKQVE